MPLAALLTVLSACGKDPLTNSSVAGKWQVDSIGLKSTGSNGIETTTTIYRNTGQNFYYDFRADGNLYLYLNNVYDTLKSYQVVDGKPRSFIKYQTPFIIDSIVSISNNRLTLQNPQGNKSILYFSR